MSLLLLDYLIHWKQTVRRLLVLPGSDNTKYPLLCRGLIFRLLESPTLLIDVAICCQACQSIAALAGPYNDWYILQFTLK